MLNQTYITMSNSDQSVIEAFGNRLRVRVCGICLQGSSVLMVKHSSINKEGIFWSPPGGGLEYSEPTEEALKREFIEETGLTITVERFLCTHEFLSPPLHGIELFFLVSQTGGQLITGTDPEMEGHQILQETRFMEFEELKALPPTMVHHLFSFCHSIDELNALSGLYRYYRGTKES